MQSVRVSTGQVRQAPNRQELWVTASARWHPFLFSLVVDPHHNPLK